MKYLLALILPLSISVHASTVEKCEFMKERVGSKYPSEAIFINKEDSLQYIYMLNGKPVGLDIPYSGTFDDGANTYYDNGLTAIVENDGYVVSMGDFWGKHVDCTDITEAYYK